MKKKVSDYGKWGANQDKKAGKIVEGIYQLIEATGVVLKLGFVGLIFLTVLIGIKKSFQYGFTCEGIPEEKVMNRLFVKTGNAVIISVLTCWAILTLGSLWLGINASMNEVKLSASMIQASE